jgi:hypothetical protein
MPSPWPVLHSFPSEGGSLGGSLTFCGGAPVFNRLNASRIPRQTRRKRLPVQVAMRASKAGHRPALRFGLGRCPPPNLCPSASICGFNSEESSSGQAARASLAKERSKGNQAKSRNLKVSKGKSRWRASPRQCQWDGFRAGCAKRHPGAGVLPRRIQTQGRASQHLMIAPARFKAGRRRLKARRGRKCLGRRDLGLDAM